MAEVNYYVIIVGRPGRTNTGIITVAAESPKQAHDFAAKRYRDEHRLAPNIHISTTTAKTADTEEAANDFVERLFALMEEHRIENPA